MSIPGTINRNGLVGEWLLDGNALDTSGSGNNGTATNVTYTGTDRGYQSQTGVFNGSSAYIALNSKIATGAKSFSFWLKTTSTTDSIIFDEGSRTSTTICDTIDINQTANKCTYWVFRGSSGNYKKVISTTSINSGNWIHIVCTDDGSSTASNLKMYINGTLDATGTQTGTAGTQTGVANSNAILGASIGLNTYLNGNIQCFKVYNREITSTQEIQSLYMEGLRKLGGAGLAPLSDGLVAYYDFNGDVTQDIISGNTLTNTGSISSTTDVLGTNRAAALGTVNSTKYLSFSSNTPFGLTRNQAQTYIIWYKQDSEISSTSYPAGFYCLLNSNFQFSGTDGQSYGIYYDYTSGTRRLRFDGAWRANTSYYHNVTLGTGWHCICMTYSGTDTGVVTGFLDGASVISGNQITGSTASSNHGFVLGANNGAIQYSSGNIGEAMLFNRALSASEVLALYQLSSTRYLTPLLH